MTVTVCIPAYLSGAYIKHTVASVVQQSHGDWLLHIAIDPAAGDDQTRAHLAGFENDPRISIRTNPERLGWAGNIRALLQQVQTEFYAILPHDDYWHLDYLKILLTGLQQQPEAIVAYADFFSVGTKEPFRKAVTIPWSLSRDEQTRAFLLEAAEAMPWRGVTRSKILPHIDYFPTDEFMGYAVECEYAMKLVQHGAVLHLPQMLYFKRLHAAEQRSASKDRVQLQDQQRLQQAWQQHARAMRQILKAGSGATKPALQLALEAALLGRWQQLNERRLPEPLLAQAEAGLQQALQAPADAAIAAFFALLLSRDAFEKSNTKQAEDYAQQALQLHPQGREIVFWNAQLLVHKQPFKALELWQQLLSSYPAMRGLPALGQRIEQELARL